MIDVVIELLLVWVIGVAAIAAAFVLGDVTGDWMSALILRFARRYHEAKIRMGWWEVAARHKRKVKA